MDLTVFGDKRFKFIMICSFVWGVVAHGMEMFHKFSYHDDAMWVEGFADHETYGLGRWGLGVAGKLASVLYGGRHSSTSAVNSVITIASIAIILFLICVKLNIENRVIITALSGVMTCFPAITAIFGFVYTAHYYYFAALIGVLGAYVFYEHKSIGTFIVCALFMTVSAAVYQANIPINMMVLLLFMLEEVYSSELNWRQYIFITLKNVLMCISFMALYLLGNKALLFVMNMELSDYKGVSSFGMTGVTGYVTRIFDAYKRFLNPADYLIQGKGISANMFPWGIKYYHMLLIVTTVVLIIMLFKKVSSVRKIVMLSLIVMISPFFAYFIYFMAGEPEVHGLMTYGEVFMFFIPAYAIERLGGVNKESGRVINVFSWAGIALMLVIAVLYTRYANVCYLKADVMQTEAISYYNTLITRIQSTEGYTADTPVVYIEDRSKNDDSFSGNKAFDPIYLPPYQGNSIINDFAWEETMELWCGFAPVKGDEEELDPKVIEGMSVYPDDGSVKMVKGTVVVKFSD